MEFDINFSLFESVSTAACTNDQLPLRRRTPSENKVDPSRSLCLPHSLSFSIVLSIRLFSVAHQHHHPSATLPLPLSLSQTFLSVCRMVFYVSLVAVSEFLSSWHCTDPILWWFLHNLAIVFSSWWQKKIIQLNQLKSPKKLTKMYARDSSTRIYSPI